MKAIMSYPALQIIVAVVIKVVVLYFRSWKLGVGEVLPSAAQQPRNTALDQNVKSMQPTGYRREYACRPF